MTTTQGQRAQESAPGAGTKLTVLVAEKDESIRNALGDLLEGAGYAVARLEELGEAEARIESALEPLILVVGNGDVVDEPGLQHFTVVAVNPVTQQVSLYFTHIPQQRRVPILVQRTTRLLDSFDPLDSLVDGPHELEHLLDVVAAAAARARSSPAHQG
jgi:CheY-like chemotaxis protein